MNLNRTCLIKSLAYLSWACRLSKHEFQNNKISNAVLCNSLCCPKDRILLHHQTRFYSDKNNSDDPDSSQKDMTLRGGIASRYKIFQDFESPVILDVDEERQLLRENPEALQEQQTRINNFEGYSLERGKTGIFDVEELVDVLRKEHAENITVLKISPEYQYVDYMVIVTGKSVKHIKSLALFIKGLHKRKRSEKDNYITVEGELSDDWKAIDLGNIVLHIMTQTSRENYHIEVLWAVGKEYDDLSQDKDDEYITLLKEYSHPALLDLKPVDVDTETALLDQESVDTEATQESKEQLA